MKSLMITCVFAMLVLADDQAKIYRNVEEGYQIAVPAGWSVKTGPEGVLKILYDKDPRGDDVTIAIRGAGAWDKSLDAFADVFTAATLEQGPLKGARPVSSTKLAVNDADGKLSVFTYTDKGVPHRAMLAFFLKNRVSAVIVVICTQKAHEQLEKLVRDIVNSFAFLERTIVHPLHMVYSVAFSPDGQTLASAGEDNAINLWEVLTGRLIQTLTGHRNGVWTVAFSPDGRSLATGSGDATARLWEVQTGRLLRTFSGHTSEVGPVVFSPDGRLLATGSRDATVRIWDAPTALPIRTLTGHSRGVRSLTFSSDGRTLFTGSLDSTVKVWDVATGRVKLTMDEGSPVSAITLSADDQTLASAGGEDAVVKVWDAQTGRPKRLLQLPGGATSLAFPRDGRTLAVGNADGTVGLWDTVNWSLKRTIKAHEEGTHCCLAISPDGRTIATGSGVRQKKGNVIEIVAGEIKIWDTLTGDLKRTLTSK